MTDCREKFLQSVTGKLVESSISADRICEIREIIIGELSNYTINESCTDIAIKDDMYSSILKLYCGTLLTEGKSEKTLYIYKRVIERFLIDVNKPIQHIGVFDIRIWLGQKQQQVSKVTCENYRAYLSSFFMWLCSEEIIDKNPMQKIKPIKYEKTIKKPFSDVEIDNLRSSCETLRERAEFELLMSSGVRVSELGGLNISDVNFDTLEILVKNGKGGKSRVTYMNDITKHHLMKYLTSRSDDNQCLFVTRNLTRLSKSAAEGDLHRIGNRANVDNVHPHRCRRTFATNLAKSGMDLATIQMLMGHSDINVTKSYIALDKSYIKNQYNKFI